MATAAPWVWALSWERAAFLGPLTPVGARRGGREGVGLGLAPACHSHLCPARENRSLAHSHRTLRVF